LGKLFDNDDGNEHHFVVVFVEITVSSLAFRATQATAMAELSSCVILSRKSDFKLDTRMS
jgi:hypothetical protein